MTRFTVLIPTTARIETVRWSVQSVLDQTVDDFEIIVVSDGGPPALQSSLSCWFSDDKRIRFLAFDKGAGYGEAHRNAVLQQVTSPYVAYLGDDDLWCPEHLSIMAELLQSADFVHTAQARVFPDQPVMVRPERLDTTYGRQALLQLGEHATGPSSVAHTLDAYRRLPHGWRPKPHNMNSDTYMWKQWMAESWVRVAYGATVSTLHLGAPLRREMSDVDRGLECEQWYRRSRDEGFGARLFEDACEVWHQRALSSRNLHRIADALADSDSDVADADQLLVLLAAAEHHDHRVRYLLRRALQLQDADRLDLAQSVFEVASPQATTNEELLQAARFLLRTADPAAARFLDLVVDPDDQAEAAITAMRSRLANMPRD